MKLYIKSILLFIVVITAIFLVGCGSDDVDVEDDLSYYSVGIKDIYYVSWNFDKDVGESTLSPNNLGKRSSYYYEKLNGNGQRLIKGFYHMGIKQDFWTYYDPRGNISKIEFYDSGKVTQTINYSF